MDNSEKDCRDRSVLLLDSGIGGLTIARAIRHRQPALTLHYIADNDGFPYGDLPAARLIQRVCMLVEQAITVWPVDAVVIACNTASTVVLPTLRARLSVPVVGVVPAIRPAATASCSSVIGLLATPGTVKSEHVASLIERFAGHCRVLHIGAPGLAALAEQRWREGTVNDDALAKELAPLFAPEWQVLDQLVLGCTHYPLLRDEIQTLVGPHVRLVDSAEAVAHRLEDVLDSVMPTSNGRSITAGSSFRFTRDGVDNAMLTSLIQEEGFEDIGVGAFSPAPVSPLADHP